MNESFLWIVFYVVMFLFFSFLIMIAYDKGKFSKIPTVLGIDKWQAMRAPLKLLTVGFVVLVLGLGYWFFFRSHKSEEKPKYGQSVVESGVYAQPEIPVVPEPKSLKAGEQTDWILIMGRWITILPNDNNVEYEFKDDKGNVRSARGGKDLDRLYRDKNGKRNLRDTTQYIRFRSSTDISYIVERN